MLSNKSVPVLLSRLCADAGVTLIRGRANRQMVHLPDIMHLLRYLAEQYKPECPGQTLGFDRISLLVWLSGLDKELAVFGKKGKTANKAGYARRLEIEIYRIASLAQPARAVAAVEFMRRISDAKTVVDAAGTYLKERYGDIGEDRHRVLDECKQWLAGLV